MISCLIGSVIVVEMERNAVNRIPGFHVSLNDGMFLWGVLTIFSLLVSLPLILIIYVVARKSKNLAKSLFAGLGISFVLSYFITFYFCESYAEAFYLTIPYFLAAFIFGVIYLKMESSVVSSEISQERQRKSE